MIIEVKPPRKRSEKNLFKKVDKFFSHITLYSYK